MHYIAKNNEPTDFEKWRKTTPGCSFNDMPREIKDSIRYSLLDEQGYVCCFCGKYFEAADREAGGQRELTPDDQIKPESYNIAHIIPRAQNPALALCYSNFGLSCSPQIKTPKNEHHCDQSQGSRKLPIDPQTLNCIEFFEFKLDGYVSAKGSRKDDAAETIRILNLNAKRLITRRKEVLKGIEELIIADQSMRPDAIKSKFSSKENGRFAQFYFAILSCFCS